MKQHIVFNVLFFLCSNCIAQQRIGKIILYRTEKKVPCYVAPSRHFPVIKEDISGKLYSVSKANNKDVGFVVINVNDSFSLHVKRNDKEIFRGKISDEKRLFIYKVNVVPLKGRKAIYRKYFLTEVSIKDFEHDSPNLYKVLGLDQNLFD